MVEDQQFITQNNNLFILVPFLGREILKHHYFWGKFEVGFSGSRENCCMKFLIWEIMLDG